MSDDDLKKRFRGFIERTQERMERLHQRAESGKDGPPNVLGAGFFVENSTRRDERVGDLFGYINRNRGIGLTDEEIALELEFYAEWVRAGLPVRPRKPSAVARMDASGISRETIQEALKALGSSNSDIAKYTRNLVMEGNKHIAEMKAALETLTDEQFAILCARGGMMDQDEEHDPRSFEERLRVFRKALKEYRLEDRASLLAMLEP